MRKRKGRSETSETLIGNGDGGDKIREKEEKGFFACYLLTSLSPRHKGHTYIGFTVNPRRRIRQHNGEIRSGAWRTKSKRPWEMVLCIYGFPTNVSALQFEWAWQHPKESLAVRKAAASLKSLSGLANKIKLVYTMLTLPAWQSLNLTVNFFSTKYTKHSAGCLSLPEQMKVQVCPMEELPCYMEGDNCLYENEDDRDDEEECDETGSTDGSIKEGLTDLTIQNSADYHNSIEMPTQEQFGWVEGNDTRQTGNSPTPKEDFRQPCCLSNSPMRTFASLARLVNTKGGTVEDRDTFGLIEDGDGVEFDRLTRQQLPAIVAEDKDQPPMGLLTRKQLQAIVAEDKDQPPISLSVSREVEVIDVLTPSPDCRISLRSKKRRRAANVRSEIIDLTKSPIFVQL